MPIRRYKPTSAGRRFMSVSTFEEVTKTTPEKSLLAPVAKKGGRHPVTPWGVPTLGKRTRRKHKETDKLIVRGRRRGKERR